MAVQLINGLPVKSTGRPHISHTQVSMFDSCMLHWYLRYVCKIRKPSTIQMMVGTVVHEVLAANFSQKAMTGVDLEIPALLDAYSAGFDKRANDHSACELQVGQIPGDFKDAGAALLAKYMIEVAPPLAPALTKLPDEHGVMVDSPIVELELAREIPGTGVDFVGVIDMREYNGKVIDYKVVGKKWGKNDADKKRQAIAYGFLLDEEISGEFHVGVRSAAKPIIQIVPAPVTRYDIDGYVGHLWDVVEAMKVVANGDMEPRVSSGFCNEKLCQHYYECRDWKMGTLEVTPDPGNWVATESETIEEAA